MSVKSFVKENRIIESSTGQESTLKGVLFTLPYLLIFFVFLVYPIAKGFYMSLFEWNPVIPSESEFILFDNYIQMFNDPLFWRALVSTVYFVVLTVPTLVILGLVLALGVNRNIKGKYLLRTIFFSPYVLTVSVVALVWQEMAAPDYGPINYYLGFLIENPPAWLSSYDFAMPMVALATVWWTAGFNFIILLAARQGISERLYEAARLDGASAWNAFRDITLPQMRPALVLVVILQFIASFQIFGQVYIMTNGGPGYSTQTLVMYLYRAAFESQNFGYAAAVGYFLFFVLIAVSALNFFILGGEDE